ncbi:uncharacterized protein LY89DRAFT_667589 [Mollisia scopiformis]|uniref:Uncharacterized protein n=1 Tax=Mollisia scopiformis TaxID=149040 RepID=A0A194XE89_MOLSC|nr:uncharacterized protein LY89DRAFT_667589 [Mollisia scopiformis]KUJ18500.1 hypothetical protein LY89DRAFT_667589 [Mollisia scopiformis]
MAFNSGQGQAPSFPQDMPLYSTDVSAYRNLQEVITLSETTKNDLDTSFRVHTQEQKKVADFVVDHIKELNHGIRQAGNNMKSAEDACNTEMLISEDYDYVTLKRQLGLLQTFSTGLQRMFDNTASEIRVADNKVGETIKVMVQEIKQRDAEIEQLKATIARQAALLESSLQSMRAQIQTTQALTNQSRQIYSKAPRPGHLATKRSHSQMSLDLRNCQTDLSTGSSQEPGMEFSGSGPRLR